MKAASIARHLSAVAFSVGMSLLIAQTASADTLTFSDTPAANAVAAMSQKYGVGIVFRGNVDVNRPVTFSIADADSPDGRLQAISTLASALGLKFQKVYVVSKIDPGAALPKLKVDSTGRVAFTSNQIAAKDAIETVAAADAATTQISSAITGDVTFPRTMMSVPDAAAEIAKQTQTQWKVYYALYARGEEPQRLAGRIIDYTANGNPIMELPLVTYVTPDPPIKAVPLTDTSATSAAANNTFPAGYNPYGYGAYPFQGVNPLNSMVADPNNGAIPVQGGFGQPSIYTVPNTSVTLPPGFTGPIFTNGYNGNGYDGYSGYGYNGYGYNGY